MITFLTVYLGLIAGHQPIEMRVDPAVKSVRLLLFRSSTRRWAELHEETFRRLGGAVKVVSFR